ncbi:50S ribosomal protein L22 [Methylacidimicrobium sp. AP8]|nr:50S ribosomal protein L22 [Methylacidimicrobium sp. AP8]CAB4243859.1 50S ribosomal protein L22 [Methylacidimicrobium sp. AP8]
MQVKAINRFVRMSAFKLRDVARCIQGMRAEEALAVLAHFPKEGARHIRRTLASALANAENNHGLHRGDLLVKEARIGEATTIKRFQPKARGSAGPIRKRTSHIRIVLEPKEEE